MVGSRKKIQGGMEGNTVAVQGLEWVPAVVVQGLKWVPGFINERSRAPGLQQVPWLTNKWTEGYEFHLLHCPAWSPVGPVVYT